MPSLRPLPRSLALLVLALVVLAVPRRAEADEPSSDGVEDGASSPAGSTKPAAASRPSTGDVEPPPPVHVEAKRPAPSEVPGGRTPSPLLAAVGAASFGVGYAAQVWVLGTNDSLAFVPAAGVVIRTGELCGEFWRYDRDWGNFGKLVCVTLMGGALVDAALQVGGVSALVLGIVGLPAKRSPTTAGFRVSPITTAGGAGVGIGGTF